MNILSIRQRSFGRALLVVAILAALFPNIGASAVQFPAPASSLFFQTSGSAAGLGIGDWYTSSSGGNTDHVILLPVPAHWPSGTSVTVAIYDPESQAGSTGLATNDEVRNTADTTRFTLRDGGGGVVATQDFASPNATHGSWYELATFIPVPGTTYELHSLTGVNASSNGQRDDDNSWRLSFTHDPGCAVNTTNGDCSVIESGDETDDPDGVPGTGDELAMGFKRASYQYQPQSCVTFWFYVDGSANSSIVLHNFDLDNNQSVTYTKPGGSTVTGTVSGGTVWNGSTTSTRVGDTVAVSPADTGWWRSVICANANNQFIFEVGGQVPVYFAQPPTPRMTIAIDDADLDIAQGEPHHYAITLENTSDTTSAPGAAFNTVVDVPLPSGVDYVSCTAPAGATCSYSAGSVTFTFTSPISAGASVPLAIDAEGGSGMPASVDLTATVRYEDSLGNDARPVSASDVDLTRYPDLTVTIGPDVTAAPGDVVVMDVDIANIGDHIQPGVVVSVPIPVGVSIDGPATGPEWSCGDGATAPVVCTWTVGLMGVGGSDTSAIAFSVPQAIAAGVEALDVDATISGDYWEPVLDNNIDSATVTVDAAPDLAITVVAPPEYIPGSQTGWSVLVENVGDQDASGVVATVTVPTDADATPAGSWVCVPDTTQGSICTYDVGDLDAGSSISVPFPVDTDPAAVDPATLEATVAEDGSGGPETDLTNNLDEDTIAADPQATLSVDVAVSVDPVNVGDPTSFTVTVGNTGPSVATSTVAVLTVPPALTSATPPGGCSVTGTLTWMCSIGDLAPGGTAIFVISGTAGGPSMTLAASATSPTDVDGATDADTALANRPPVAGDAQAETEDLDSVSIPVPADDPDGDDLTITVSAPEGSAVVVVGAGGPEVVYTPGPTTAGTVTLTYEACDPDGLCDTGTIDVLVKRLFLSASSVCIADVPYLSYDMTLVGVSGSPTATITWSNGSDTFLSTDLPLSGLALWPGAAVDDTTKPPAERLARNWPGWILEDDLWIVGDDGFTWATGSVTVVATVNPTSQPIAVSYPAATPDCAAVPDGPNNRPPVGTDLSGWASAPVPYVVDLLAGTSDPDGDIVSIVSVTPTSGKVTVVDGVLTYTPAPSDSGTVVFDVTITDGRGGYDTFTVTIEVVSARQVSGVVFVDNNGDGVDDTGDSPVTGATVTVVHPGPDGVFGTQDDVVFTAVTGPNGTWSIPSVPVGTIQVQVVATGRNTVTVVSDASYYSTPYENQLPITGAALVWIALFGSVLVGFGLLALLGAPRREE